MPAHQIPEPPSRRRDAQPANPPHSHGLRRLAAIEATRGSFDDAIEAICRSTGQQLGKRQVEQLTARTTVDFNDFYTHRQAPTGEDGDLLVLSCDGKGVVMRPGALRRATAQAAAKTNPKLHTRLSNGAEAILKLRALHTNGDFDHYWDYHLTQERRRVHQTRYLNNAIPRTA